MTVIAYKNGILASDSLVSQEGMKLGYIKKIYRNHLGWMGGGAGDCVSMGLFGKWIEVQCPRLADKEFPSLNALLIDPEGNLSFVESEGIMLPIKAPFAAAGSGADIAVGAMAAGATAIEAVEAAKEWCLDCGGETQIYQRELA